MIFLKNESKGDKPVCDPSPALLRNQTLWSAAPQWEMSQVHLIFLSLFARMYLVREHFIGWDLFDADFSLPSMRSSVVIWQIISVSQKSSFSM